MRRRGWGIPVLVLTALSAVVLVSETLSLPVIRALGRYSIIGALFTERVLGRHPVVYIDNWGGYPTIYAAQNEDGLQITEGWMQGAEDLARSGRATVRTAWYLPDLTESGWWQPTRRWTTHAVRIDPVVTLPSEPFPITDADIAAIRAAMTHYLQDPTLARSFRWLRPVDPRLKEADYIQIEILWMGVARNILAVFALAIFLRGLWLAPWAASDMRRVFRRRRGVCEGCGYPRAGLVADRCPECGEQWEAAEQQAARA